jgi:hypothetical protein
MLIRREITEELQQDHFRQVRFLAGFGASAFSRNASSSPWMDASSDEEASQYGLKDWLGGYTTLSIRQAIFDLKGRRDTLMIS